MSGDALRGALEQARIAAMANAVTSKLSATPHYCRTCNKDVGSKWQSTCPHCCSMRSIVPGIPERSDSLWLGGDGKPTLLKDVVAEDHERISTGTRELDRVLGGGLVMGGVVLISGDPGIGKSTLLLQVSIDLSIADVTDEDLETHARTRTEPFVILYVSAEETKSQIKNRATRIASDSKYLWLYNECDVFEIEKHIIELRPDVLIIDSIQTMFKPDVEGGAGSITQVRECTAFIIDLCKKKNRIGCFLVAHINKDSVVAGPKTLEHLVDTTLEFHKEGLGELRSIRTGKNRFGSTDEMALFRMTKDGLKSIENPSELLLEHHKGGRQAGICVGLVARGPRPLAVEVQTLLGPSASRDPRAGMQFKRTMTGLSTSRATQVIAVLQRRIGLDMNRECFVNVPGGLDEIRDPALDLPLALALASYALDIALPESFIAYGEIGLAGEIRPVTYAEARIKSAALMGFKRIMGPVMPSYEAADIIATLTSSSSDPESGGDEERGDGKTDLAERYFGVASLEEAFDFLEGFVITPHEPKRSEIRPDKRKKNASIPNLYVVKKGPEEK